MFASDVFVMERIEVRIRFRAVAIITQVRSRLWRLIAELVQLRDCARVDGAAVTF